MKKIIYTKIGGPDSIEIIDEELGHKKVAKFNYSRVSNRPA